MRLIAATPWATSIRISSSGSAEIDRERIVGRDAEAVFVRQRASRNPSAGPSRGWSRYGTESNTLSRTPIGELRNLVAHAIDDRQQQPRAAGQIAAEPAGPMPRAQELVQQVAVAGLHVDELKADLVRQPRGGHVVVDQLLELGVGPHDRIVARVDLELGVRAADDGRRSAARIL